MNETPPSTANAERRVLIVCPRFPPSNAPDMHRVRMALPWMNECGWTATVLCVEPQFVPVPEDPLLVAAIPADVTVVRTRALPLNCLRRFGIGNLALRSYQNLCAAGDRLLSQKRFDVVYFSTTEFGVFRLGPRWLAKFGVPYLLDYQDPWLTDYYRQNKIAPPGGRLKHAITQCIGRFFEPSIVRNSAHITVVSPAYVQQLRARYAVSAEHLTVLPFGGASTDFDLVDRECVQNPIFAKNDGIQHWLYAGVAGPYMQKSITAIFMAFRRALQDQPSRFKQVRMHFVGTDYATGNQAQERILPIARSLGIEDYVHEQTARCPYFQVLRSLRDADALIVPGSDDPGYTASKIYPYILADKPLLTVFHQDSSVRTIMRQCRAGVSVTFSEHSSVDETSAEVFDRWFAGGGYEKPPETDWPAFEPYTARHMTRVLTKIFTEVLMKRTLSPGERR